MNPLRRNQLKKAGEVGFRLFPSYKSMEKMKGALLETKNKLLKLNVSP